MQIIRVDFDLAKDVFQFHGVDGHEKPVWRRRLARGKWLEALTLAVEPGDELGLEACAGAHHWGRELQARGFTVRLIAPQFVKPYVKSSKSDRNDAEAICEAMNRPTMRFVALKTVEQQDEQAVHRVRSELVGQRTSKENQIRGLVGEFGCGRLVDPGPGRSSIRCGPFAARAKRTLTTATMEQVSCQITDTFIGTSS